ncbi:hypothetical protein C8F04DRAFT_1075674 [Mycena alexandri]|uniref:Uncharacterized protein n=1 Tax=Mycena alexandri TaxID=1745969 RepID=A0AAD6X7W8_9AGAR|nr:hypothetical protein C8F04DRAFT_1090306 [Mycena alexandri]KAJ7042368.1 hypothetical protein C8F04DRAFT_1075674 [Mycena alexandri]
MVKSFSNPHHFIHEADGWLCNVCNGEHAHMNIHAAIRHERSAQHARMVQESNMWWNPSSEDAAISWLPTSPDADVWNAPLEEDPPLTKEELQMREHQYHVERVADIVPYWIKMVNAAAHGEELRLEPFLNTLQDVSHSWLPPTNPWAQTTGSGGWGDRGGGDTGRWGVHPAAAKSASSGSAHGSRTPGSLTAAGSVPATGYAFVENIARQESVTDVERKRRMHMFFEMPTNEKVKKIDEIVRYLQSASV